MSGGNGDFSGIFCGTSLTLSYETPHGVWEVKRNQMTHDEETTMKKNRLLDRDRYILQHAPTILAALVMRRQSTNPDQLVEQAISGAEKIYDVVHEIDSPATTMLSRPVDEH